MASSGRHRTGGRYQRHELIAAAGAAVLLVVIAVLWTWAHHSLSTARLAPSNTATALPASAAPALPLGSRSLRELLRAWLDEAEPSIDSLSIAGENVVAAASRADIAGTRAACQTARDALANAQQHLPSPDSALNTALQQAFDDYQAGTATASRGRKTRTPSTSARARASPVRERSSCRKHLTLSRRTCPPTLPCLLRSSGASELVADQPVV
jgi:hypothetical protein